MHNTVRFIFPFLLIILFFSSEIEAQVVDPIKWTTETEKISDTEYLLVSKANLDAGWHLYSQQVPDGGPVATSFMYDDSNGDFRIVGNTKEEEGKVIQDPVFEMEIKYFENSAVFKQKIEVTEEVERIQAFVEYMVCDDTRCLPPEEEELTFNFTEETTAETATGSITGGTDSTLPEAESSASESRGLLTIFFLSFLGGFAALLTPCVFPMIPMTVSFFTKQSKTRASGIKNALLYGLFIIVIYVVLGSVVTAIFGADSLNALSTNVVFNLVFFALLVFFACSFLGAFELVLPSSWATKIDSQADRDGLIGIFFMALALAIVSFSCTGPIVGTLLVESASKGGIAPIVGMLGFSLAIALPFALFAAFPGWLNSLPKSGGWLNTVKVVLGFLELAFAFKFLSNADLVLQLHLLERETFLAIWIAIFGALAFYLFGKITLPHDSPLPHISVGRLGLGLFVLAFVVYMIPGLWGAPLQWISGFPPPTQYSESPYGVGNTKGVAGTSIELPDQAELGPLDLITFKDYEAGMAYAKKVNKPVMLDFTGYACVNCRKMEERVWPEPQVQQVLRDELVLISLYVDDKKELLETEQYISETTGKKIKTVGNKWSDFQIKHYKANAQPYYVLINNDGENLNDPTAYDPDVESYLAWLKEGIGNYSN
ncbi:MULTISPECIES: thioredoxin family protein [unclassified Leeuwenhoekiella]|uniref:protein-disulfide reductase DsbD family protein n=1 Tax=unclassified Leeuwenhoekiella TaxID=2615029 RepID=UPI000C54DC30|nr:MULTISPECIES: thioredoxin family protein [unclassified Leeuwenhoekiella]MAW95395.1 thiol:disulfide interchange protein [Leeuwenhoekiella sp.]MBA80782.1 thiol:disulfide interchange protein [Leeuwenhoekiella sp.]|tara:strand:- start:12391 stop:14361 length:1971 start_codon:yes stop_codon:yes gene_type:complete